jgi:C-terminal processing protease CtpA/Prc
MSRNIISLRIISGSEANARHTITAAIDGTPAQQAGLRPGDEIIAADGTPFEPFLIGSGLLLLAVEDVRVDGERLEGVGVTPTIEV